MLDLIVIQNSAVETYKDMNDNTFSRVLTSGISSTSTDNDLTYTINSVVTRFKDMGDGTFAKIVYVG